MYRVLARKWRPQSFDELVGQPQVARTLTNAIESDRLAHAYIFSGLRGTGKTTVARILAKCLNCESGPTVKPCDQCGACVEIAESRAIDVLEIDAASRTKVEQTRELLEVVSYAPVRDRYKILIIDEAHMLSKASFNALLKTLEEPPPNVLFVLATTELQKILPTILSRCQVFEFRRVGATELTAHLRKICAEEQIEISDGALERIARAGEGSVRDALSLLERAVAFCGQQVEDDDVLRMLGTVQARVLVDLVDALARRDAGGMLRVLDGLVDEGHDLLHFWGALIATLRDLLMLRALPDGQELLTMPPDEAEALVEAAQDLSREDLIRAFQLLADLEPGLKSSSQPRFLFEAALMRLASLGAVRPIEELLQTLPATASEARPAARARAAASRPAPPAVQKKKPDETLSAEPPPQVPAGGGDSAVITAVCEARPMLGAMLEQASEFGFADGTLSIRFPEGMDAVQRQVEAKDSVELLRRAAESIHGGTVTVRIEQGGESPAAPTPTPTPADGGGPSVAPDPPAASGTTSPAEDGELLERARSEPGVKKLLDAFGARVVDIRRNTPSDQRIQRGRSPRPPEDAP